jgi:hypothetical protein
MNEGTALILAFCAVALVGAAVVLWAALRFAGGVLPEWLSSLSDVLGGDSGDAAPAPLSRGRSSRRRPDLRQQAQSLDFDAALARHRQENNAPPAPPPAGIQNISAAPQRRSVAPPWSDHVPVSGNGDKPALRRRRDRNQDEIFGGRLDEDGDGDLDF